MNALPLAGLIGIGAATRASPFQSPAWPSTRVGLRIFVDDPGTTTGYVSSLPSEGTGVGGLPAATASSQWAGTRNAAPAILELHRISGLTFEELARLLRVTRRSLHHWANGRRIAGANEARLYRLLAAMRRMDRGDAARNRRLLLEPDETGKTLLNLLAEGRIDEAERRAGRGPGRTAGPSVPLSAEAWATRHPPHPADLIGGSSEPIATPEPRLLRSRPVRLLRPRRTGQE